jgi:PKD repeat protein
MLRNSDGTNIQTKQISIPTGESRITLDFIVNPGTDYQLACSQSNNLYRNNAGCAYPYDINGVISIKSSSATTAPTSYYYYFYDWEVQEEDCKSPRIEILAIVSDSAPVPAFSYTMNDPVVHFTDQTVNPGMCTWDFGDGTTVSGSNPSYKYKANGVYNVKLKVFNGCGLDSVSQQITIVATGVEQYKKESQIKVYPNPANDRIYITGNMKGNQKSIMLYDIRGKLINSVSLGLSDENINESIDLSGLSSGIYIVKVSSKVHSEVFRVLKH